ncbi:hypothetical protein [Bacillus smithii]|uniref:hypothetical protein n=1 Tax=Bacillus smithii TaxID=1479 RepID=UPI0022E4B640|nr:hypothetical protein [Bacillus smithii]
MDINYWNIIDAMLLIVQFFLILIYFRREYSQIGIFPSIILSFSAWLLATPVGLFPVAILPIGDENKIIRNFFWHYKISGLTINDFLIIFCCFCLIVTLLNKNFRLDKWFVKYSFITLLIFIVGFISAIQAPMKVDVERFFIVLRYMLILILGSYTGYLIGIKSELEIFYRYLKLLFSISIISIISMLLLDTSYRPPRYWTYAILQSQETQSTFLIVFALSLFGIIKGNRRIFYLTISLIPAIFGYKYSIIMVSIILAFFVFQKIISKKLFYAVESLTIIFIVYSLVIIPTIFVVWFTTHITQFDAIGTRYFQIINVIETIKNEGWKAIVFGIGWNQWYKIYYEFPYIDFGAWTIEQLENPNWKYSVQIIPYSLVRSVGIFGFIVWINLVVKIGIKLYKNLLFSLKFNPLLSLILVSIIIPTFLSFPDVLPESMMNSSILLIGIASYRSVKQQVI